MPFFSSRATENLVEKCPYTSEVRDALNNAFGECVVAKANEADCGAQTPKSKHVRKGESAIRVHVVQLLYRKNLHLFRVFL